MAEAGRIFVAWAVVIWWLGGCDDGTHQEERRRSKSTRDTSRTKSKSGSRSLSRAEVV